LSVANNRERVNFEQQILALLLVHLTLNLSCIKFAHISPQVQGLCISSSSPHETFHIATNAISIRMKKTTGAAIGYNVRVAKNNLRYNLRLRTTKKKERKAIRPNL